MPWRSTGAALFSAAIDQCAILIMNGFHMESLYFIELGYCRQQLLTSVIFSLTFNVVFLLLVKSWTERSITTSSVFIVHLILKLSGEIAV